MSFELLIIIVGVVLVLITIGDSLKTNFINANLRIPMGIIGVLLLIYGGYSYGGVNLQGQIEQADVGNKRDITYPIEDVQVISPLNGDSVQCRILTMGVYPTGHEQDIWVLLKPSDNRYYPQSDHTNTSYKRNGEWQVITRFGGDKGESYELIVYEADAGASSFFSETILEWKVSNAYPGLEANEIPKGATEVSRMKVVLQENCRGVF
ncbi:MAG: hypothetical protein HRT61_18200 [Ekhidna sp.]|nr:hypothetical protein [Ekhidna sp.]